MDGKRHFALVNINSCKARDICFSRVDILFFTGFIVLGSLWLDIVRTILVLLCLTYSYFNASHSTILLDVMASSVYKYALPKRYGHRSSSLGGAADSQLDVTIDR